MTNEGNEQSDDAAAMRRANAAVSAVMRLADLWQITEADVAILIGGVPRATVRLWRQQLEMPGPMHTHLTCDQFDRVSDLLGIYKALHTLFPDERQADGWLHRPVDAPYFDGRSALDVMRQGNASAVRHVRWFLESGLA